MNRTPADRPDHPRANERFNEDAATFTVKAPQVAQPTDIDGLVDLLQGLFYGYAAQLD